MATQLIAPTSAIEDPGLDAPFALPGALIEAFRADGCVTVPGVFPRDLLEGFEREFTTAVDPDRNARPLAERDTYQKAFIQVGMIWKRTAALERFVRGRRLARIAAQLLGCRGVRLYHDQALYKEAGGGHTPWHCDQQYWPLDNPRSITAWIPLQDTPLEMGPIAFAPGSQHLTVGRDLPISDDSEQILERALTAAGFPLRVRPFAFGDVSFHLGWTYHRAGPNTTARERKAMTIIYMDKDTRVAQPATPSQEWDRRTICPDVPIGEVIDTEHTPVLYEE